MDHGSYRKKVKFEAFKSEKFVPHLFGPQATLSGCGATALGLLTGVNPLHLPRKKDWSSRFMIGFLHKYGFETAKLTKCNLTVFNTTTYPIGSRHVALVAIKLIKHQASWIVVHNYKTYHNFEINDFNPYELMNHPIVSMYLITHPSWKETTPIIESQKPKQKQVKRLRPRFLGTKFIRPLLP